MTDSRWIDPEIEDIFADDPELAQLAHLVKASRPEAPLDNRFPAVLRAQLMREAPVALAPSAKPARQRAVRPRLQRRAWWQRSTPFAWGGAGLGVALVGAAVLTLLHTNVQDHQVTAGSPVAELHAVSPDNVITVSFNEPMNQTAVVAGLRITPATQVTTRWSGNNLLITPTHHLAGNTPYTVTIPHSATVSANGSLAASDIRISFGTAPTPPPGPVIAQLTPHTLGPVGDGAQLISAGDGTFIATSSNRFAAAGPPSAASTPTSSPSPASSSTPTAGATASGSPTSPTAASTSAPALPTTTPPSAPSGELVSLSASGTTDLGPAATSAAVAPNGLSLIAAIPTASGTALELVPLDGSSRTRLASLASSVGATGWLSGTTALAAEPDRIVSIDLQGHVRTLVTLPSNTTGVVFAPDGHHAFAGSSSTDGVLIDLTTASRRPLPGSREVAAFSGNGKTVAWVDATGTPIRLLSSPVSHDGTTTVPLVSPVDAITAIALDPSGAHLAMVDRAAGTSELDVLSLPTGTVIARGPGATNPVYATSGDRLAFVSGGLAEVATLPGVAPGTAVNLLPAGAASALKALVDAQVRDDAASLGLLSAPGISIVGSTPSGLSRGYLVSAVSNPDGTVTATARLIVDPSAGHAAASFVDETVGLVATPGGGYLVGYVNAGALRDEPIGPHVVSVAPVSGSTLVLRVSFDSDLRAATVASAITVAGPDGSTLLVTTVYDANTRTATITVPVPTGTAVTLTVATTLVDVNGQALASPFSVVSGG